MREIDLVAYLTDDETITAEFVPVNLNVPPVLKEKTITANGVYSAETDSATGYSSVTVCVPDRAITTGELNITPEITSQTFEVPSYWDGYGPVNVAAVTSTIDSNIQPENIKQGTTILGVQGSVIELDGETVNITPTTNEQVIEPTSPKNAITRAIVSPVTSSIDPNIQPSNIKEGATILGVSGSVVESNETTLNVTPTTSAQTLSPTSPYTGFDEVNVSAVTSSIDANIQPENIRENVTILGTTGTAYVPEYFVDFSVSRETLTKKAKMINLSGVTAIGTRALLSEYNGLAFPAHTHIDMSSITNISNSGCYGMFALTTGVESVDLSGLKSIFGDGCDAMFKNNTGIVNVDMSSLSKIGYHDATYEMFYGCTSLTTVNLSSLKEINAMYAAQYMFYGCTALTTIDLSSLVVAWNTSSVVQFFKGCASLTNVDLSRLTTIGNASQMFADCTSLVRMDFPSLMHTNYISSCSQMFMNCTSLQTLTFPSLYSGSFSGYNRTDQWYRLLLGVTGCTIHLPKNLDPQTGSTVLSSLQSYPNFGGTDTVLAYDLPSTFVLTGADTIEYERNPKYDTSTALAWRVKFTGSITDADIDWTPFYTSGTTDPQVGDTIYSDASCTTTVTTISTIA